MIKNKWYTSTEVAIGINWILLKTGKPASGIIKTHLEKLFDQGILIKDKLKYKKVSC